jgi:hypothetical protein
MDPAHSHSSSAQQEIANLALTLAPPKATATSPDIPDENKPMTCPLGASLSNLAVRLCCLANLRRLPALFPGLKRLFCELATHRDCRCVQDPIFCGAFAEACPEQVARDEAKCEATRANVEETCRVVRRVVVSSVWWSRLSSTCFIGTSCSSSGAMRFSLWRGGGGWWRSWKMRSWREEEWTWTWKDDG